MTWIFARLVFLVAPIMPTAFLVRAVRTLRWWMRVVEGVSRERIDDLWREADRQVRDRSRKTLP